MTTFIRTIWAFLKRDWLESFSYKADFFFRTPIFIAHLLTFYFINKLVNGSGLPLLGEYGGDYFSYVLTGFAVATFSSLSLSALSGNLLAEQSSGTLEAILVTRTSLRTVLLASLVQSFAAGVLQLLCYLLVGVLIFNVDLSHMNWVTMIASMAVSMLSLSGLGLLSAGFTLVYKRGDPIAFLFNAASRFLSGVYFPVAILPAWVQKFSLLLPMTYSLDCFRKAAFRGAGVMELSSDLMILFLYGSVVLTIAVIYFRWAVERSKRDGSLSLV